MKIIKNCPKWDLLRLEEVKVVSVEKEELLQFKLQQVWVLVDLPNGAKVIGKDKKDKKKQKRSKTDKERKRQEQ
ncbi:hypothetical protein Tco_0021931 [Tanacetum coccineum]